MAVAATVGAGFSFGAATARFMFAAAGGLAVGVAVAMLVRLTRPVVTDPLLANAVSLATPFVAYFLGEEAHVSGVLAVVVAGLIVGHDAPRAESGASRLQTGAVWRLVDVLLEGLVFLLIGQQLPEVVRGLSNESKGSVATAAAITVGVVLLLRPLWLVVTQRVPLRLHARLGTDAGEPLNGREIVALSWAGTRGVISLAAIFALPLTTDAGEPFPNRDLLLFCTYLVVLVTLVGQGLTFAPLLRRLGLRANESDEAQLRNEARLASIEAALTAVDDMSARGEITERITEAMRDNLNARAVRYRARIAVLQESDDGEIAWNPNYEAAVRARRAVIAAQHDELLRWRDSGRLPDTSLRKLQRELDHEERTLPDG